MIGELEEALAERRKAEQRLAAKAEELARSNAELEQYAHVVAHDLKSPLVAVGGYVQLLQRQFADRLDDRARMYIAYAVEGVNRMEALIEDLLTYARVGAEIAPLEPMDCDAVLDRVLNQLRPEMEGAGVEVNRERLPTVNGHPRLLGQVFQNLIGNALKFRGADPLRIEVKAEARGEEWVFSVRDNGVGIPGDEVREVFKMFHRVQGTSNAPGTGIGLAICKKIVERHGGEIWVESEPGRGSNFYFTLPRQA